MKIKKILAGSLVVGVMLASAVASATPPTTVGELASSVSFADVALAILAVAGAVIALVVTWSGSKFVIRAVRGAA